MGKKAKDYSLIQMRNKNYVPEDYIAYGADEAEKNEIIKNQLLSEDFIRAHSDRFSPQNFGYMSKYQVLSEDFIREFQDKVDWDAILTYQDLSKDFIIEFANCIDINLALEHQESLKGYTQEELLKEIEESLDHEIDQMMLKSMMTHDIQGEQTLEDFEEIDESFEI